MAIKDFLEERIGLSGVKNAALDMPLPGGAKLSRALGAIGVMLLVLEFMTGIALATIYAPSTDTAWSSVFYIEHHFRWGSLVRGLHYWSGQALLIVVVLHLLVTILAGAYRRPREVNWWAGLGLFALTFLALHSGSLLPWDQKSFWTTRVEAAIASMVPVFGPWTQRMIQAGRDLNSLSITRMYAVHVGAVPVLLVLVLLGHMALVRKHRPTPPPSFPDEAADDLAAARAQGHKVGTYWPDQAVIDAVAALVAVATIWWLAKRFHAPLEAPADPDGDYPARPEWFLLGLYKLRKRFEGPREIFATVLVPAAMATYFVVLPFLDRGPSRRLTRRVPQVSVAMLIVLSVVGYTAYGMRHDARDPVFQRARRDVDQRAARAVEMASAGIPPEGPLEMVRNDPLRRPGELYAEHCDTCHAGNGTALRNAHGERTNARAPTLDGFGTREWVRAMLNDPQSSELYGRTVIDDMPSQTLRLGGDFDAVVEYVYAQSLEPGDPPANALLVRHGDEVYHRRCTICHQGAGDLTETEAEERDAPDLTAWGSRRYLREQMLHPDAPTSYAARNHMTAFGDRLSARELEWVIDYVRGLRTSRRAPDVAVPPPSTEPAAQ